MRWRRSSMSGADGTAQGRVSRARFAHRSRGGRLTPLERKAQRLKQWQGSNQPKERKHGQSWRRAPFRRRPRRRSTVSPGSRDRDSCHRCERVSRCASGGIGAYCILRKTRPPRLMTHASFHIRPLPAPISDKKECSSNCEKRLCYAITLSGFRFSCEYLFDYLFRIPSAHVPLLQQCADATD